VVSSGVSLTRRSTAPTSSCACRTRWAISTYVFDRWTKDVKQRRDQCLRDPGGPQVVRVPGRHARGWRNGDRGAHRAATLGPGDFPASAYLAAAEKGFAHLQAHNVSYLDDHQENVIDDYCALLAAVELLQATNKDEYLAAAPQPARLAREPAPPRRGVLRLLARRRERRAPVLPRRGRGTAGRGASSLRGRRAGAPAREEATKSRADLPTVRARHHPRGREPLRLRAPVRQGPGQGRRSAFFFPHQNESGY
jgi:hypothetical protein